MCDKITAVDLDELAEYLTKRSKEICEDNGCTEDNHNCESYAYINARFRGNDLIDVSLVDICCSDYLTDRANCAICLPFSGDGAELFESINNEAEWSEEDEDLDILKETDDEDLGTLVGRLKTDEGEKEFQRRLKEYHDRQDSKT